MTKHPHQNEQREKVPDASAGSQLGISVGSQLGIKELIDKYGEYRRSVHQSALIMFLAGAFAATVSRSPGWVVNVGPIAGISPSGVGIVGGMMPMYGPIVLYLLYLYFYTGLMEALCLQREILPRLIVGSSDAERELLKPPLFSLPCGEVSWVYRIAAYAWLVLACWGPVVCCGLLLWDFCFLLDFDGQTVTRGYQLFYAFHHFGGIWPTGHFGAKSHLPPVYPIWQPILYSVLFANLIMLALDAMQGIRGIWPKTQKKKHE